MPVKQHRKARPNGMPDISEIIPWIEECLAKCGLTDWRVSIKLTTSKREYASVKSEPYERVTVLRISTKLFPKLDQQGQRLVIAHELGHLLLEPLDAIYDSSKDTMPREEEVVNVLSYIIAKTLPLGPVGR